MPRVVAVILNWNGRDKTRACVESLLKSTAPCDVLVVDNGSTECAPQDLVAGLDAKLLVNHENEHFARGMNRGLDAALDAKADFVWALNNDVVVEPGALAALLAAMASDPACAIAAPLVVDGRTGRLSNAGGRLSLARARTWHLHEGIDAPPGAAPYPADYVEGSAPLLRADDLRAQAGFDPAYVAYWEDVDWCLTARSRGRRALVVPGARVLHDVSGSSGVHSAYALYHRARNRYRCVRKHGTLAQRVAAPVATLAELPLDCYHLRRASGGWAAPRAWLRGTMHGLVGISGRRRWA
jgi:GT2 family glycosyltransferase